MNLGHDNAPGNADQYVFSDVEYLEEQESRARKILQISLGVVASFGVLWAAGLAITDGIGPAVIIDTAVALIALALFALARKLPYRVLNHAVFWIVLTYIWLIQYLAEGLPAPHTASVHLWFLVLVVGMFLTSLRHNRPTLFFYSVIPFASFLACEFGLIASEPAVSLSFEQKGIARGLTLAGVFLTTILLTAAWMREALKAEKSAVVANNRLEALLENMLPQPVSERLRREGKKFADGIGDCSVLFADIVGFTALASELSAEKLVRLLDEIFSRFDELAYAAGLEKIKTIGDAYMVAAGLPDPREDHAVALVQLAMEMRAVVREYADLDIRIGVNSGHVVAGIIGKRRFIYDLWGDTVNIASRMESHGVADEIQVSESTYMAIKEQFECIPRGNIAIKGKGDMPVYLLVGRRVAPEKSGVKDVVRNV